MKVLNVATANFVAACCFLSTAAWGYSLSSSPNKWGMSGTPSVARRTPMTMGGSGSDSFSLRTLFGDKPSGPAVRGARLQPHPSVRPHISPLNRLAPEKATPGTGVALPVHPEVRSGVLPNGLPYIILPNRSPPGRFEAHLQVFSGSGA